MRKQKKALILGGVAPHIELIKELKKRGYYTILADYLNNPPARKYADVFFQISVLDKEAILKLAQEENVDIVMCICVDHANVTMTYVAEKLGLPMPYAYKTAIATTDKGEMKRIMCEVGVPTSSFVVVEEISGIADINMRFPLIVKPVDNNGSKGVKTASNKEQLYRYVEDAFNFSRKGEVIVEEFSCGKEIQVDCFSNKSKAHVVMIRQKLEMPRKEGLALQSFGSILPADLSDEVIEKINNIAQSMVDAFRLEHTPFFFQAKVNNDDIEVLEVTPRIGGGLSYKMLKRQTDFDVINTIIDSYFGDVSNIEFKSKPQYMLTNIIYATEGAFDRVSGIEKVINKGIIEDFDQFIDSGTIIRGAMDSRNRVGAYFIVADTREELIRKALIAEGEIDILDITGSSIACIQSIRGII